MFFIMNMAFFCKLYDYVANKLLPYIIIARNLLWHNVCIICDENTNHNEMLCSNCAKEKQYCDSKVYCLKCGINGFFEYNYCEDCINTYKNYIKMRTILRFNSIVEQLIIFFKYFRRLDCADYIGEDIIKHYPYEHIKFDYITCVPTHIIRYIFRGYNHTKYLSEYLSKKMNIPFEFFVYKSKFVPKQAKLKKDKRFKNVYNTFELRKDININLENKNILLIEDVVTTGNTISEICRILAPTKANIYILVYADARRLERNHGYQI